MRQSHSLHLHPVEFGSSYHSSQVSKEVSSLLELTQTSSSLIEVASHWVSDTRSVSILLEPEEDSVVALFLDADDLVIVGRLAISCLTDQQAYHCEPLRTDWCEIDEQGNLVLDDKWFNSRNLRLKGSYREDFETWMIPVEAGDRLLSSYLGTENGTGRIFQGIFGYTCLQLLYFDELQEKGWMEEFLLSPTLEKVSFEKTQKEFLD